MFPKIFRTLFLVSITLMLILREQSQAQEEGKVIVISPKVGEVIDRQERDTYRLFQGFSDFQSAIFRVLPDSTYAIHITYLENGIHKTQVWKISRQELLENYKKAIDYFDSNLGVKRELWRSPVIQIETITNRTLRGLFQNVYNDSIVLMGIGTQRHTQQEASPVTSKVGLNEISRLSLPRKSSFLKSVALGLLPGAIGALIGLASGDDPPGWFSWTAEEKAAILGLSLGGIGVSIGGTLGALRGVDVEIPWQGKSTTDKRTLLAQLGTGQYHSRHFLRASPWVGRISSPHGKTANAIGGRLRFYFTPRSGLELAYGGTGWFSRSSPYGSPYVTWTERSKVDYFSGGFFISLTRKRSVIPFVAWGWGRVSTTTHSKSRSEWMPGEYNEWESKYTDSHLSLNVSGGVEVPLTNWLSLEGRVGETLDIDEGGHLGFQLALTLGPNY